jgi:hypothetical protein
VAEFLKLRTEFEVVINLAIKNYPRSAILIVNRLLAALEIDDRKPAHPETNWTVDVKPIVIGPTVPDGVAHPSE